MAHFPTKYSENYLYLLEVDPNHICVFWEVISDTIKNGAMKDYSHTPSLSLKLHFSPQRRHDNPVNNKRNSTDQHYDIPGDPVTLDFQVNGLTNDICIELKEPFSKCFAELGYYKLTDNSYIPVCSSNTLENLMKINIFKKKAVKKGPDGISGPSEKDEKGLHIITGSLSDSTDQKKIVLDNRTETGEGSQKKSKKEDYERKKDRPPHAHLITEKDVKTYYESLSNRIMPQPSFTPWRSIIESMSHKEADKRMRTSNNIYSYDENPPKEESYFSGVTKH